MPNNSIIIIVDGIMTIIMVLLLMPKIKVYRLPAIYTKANGKGTV